MPYKTPEADLATLSSLAKTIVLKPRLRTGFTLILAGTTGAAAFMQLLPNELGRHLLTEGLVALLSAVVVALWSLNAWRRRVLTNIDELVERVHSDESREIEAVRKSLIDTIIRQDR